MNYVLLMIDSNINHGETQGLEFYLQKIKDIKN